MIDIDLIYNKWVDYIYENYSNPIPDINNENHLFELGSVLRDLNISPKKIDQIIENIKSYGKIVRLDEERERKVPPGHILVKNKKSGYLYVILKSTYNDNPERYALPTNIEKSEWESGQEQDAEAPEDQVITTPKVAKAKMKAEPSDLEDIDLRGDIEDEEESNATEQQSDPINLNKFKINTKKLADNTRLDSIDKFNAKRKKFGLEYPETLSPYKIPDEVKKSALTPIIYPELVERIINTYNIDQASELNFYIENFIVDGELPKQLATLISAINFTLSEDMSMFFIEDLKNYIKYIKSYDKDNKTSYYQDSALKKDWINVSKKTKRKMLNFLADKFDDEFIIVAAATQDSNDIKALNLSKKSDKKPADVNIKINANDKDHWLRINLANDADQEEETE
jgi:hypothetical protein